MPATPRFYLGTGDPNCVANVSFLKCIISHKHKLYVCLLCSTFFPTSWGTGFNPKVLLLLTSTLPLTHVPRPFKKISLR